MFFIVDHGKGGESNYGTKAFNLGFQQIICSHIRFNINSPLTLAENINLGSRTLILFSYLVPYLH